MEAQKLEGLMSEGHFKTSFAPPSWYDGKKFAAGKKFFQENLFCVFLSHLFAILLVLSVPRILKPLIHSKKSDDPDKALKRYVSTIRIVMRWYEGDIWDTEDLAHKSIKFTREAHKFTAKKFNEKSADIDTDLTVFEKQITTSTSYYQAVREDLGKYRRCDNNNGSMVYVNQWDLSVVQYAFVGLIISHPDRFAMSHVTDEKLEGFLHFWRVIGYLMGISDDYNICSGNLVDTRQKLRSLEREEILPCFSNVDATFEYMGSALTKGMNSAIPFISFPTILQYLIDVLGGDTYNLRKRLTLRESLISKLLRFIIYFLNFNFFKNLLGKIFLGCLDSIEGCPSWLFNKLWKPQTIIEPSKFSKNFRIFHSNL